MLKARVMHVNAYLYHFVVLPFGPNRYITRLAYRAIRFFRELEEKHCKIVSPYFVLSGGERHDVILTDVMPDGLW